MTAQVQSREATAAGGAEERDVLCTATVHIA